MYLIGLNGRLHSGKDTAYEALRDGLNGDIVQRVAFADKVKLSGMAALGLTQGTDEDTIALANRLKEVGTITVSCNMHAAEYAHDHPQEHVISGREFWQWYGTEAHRDIFDDQFWVNALLPKPYTNVIAPQAMNDNQISLAFPDVDVLVITDCRFVNEATRIIELGGEVWHLDAERRLGPLPEDAHPSEHPLPAEYITRTIDANDSPTVFTGRVIDTFIRMEIDRAHTR